MLVDRKENSNRVILKYKSDLLKSIDNKFHFLAKLNNKSGYKLRGISLMDIYNSSDDGNETASVSTDEIFPISDRVRAKIDSANIDCIGADIVHNGKVFPFTIDKVTDEIIISAKLENEKMLENIVNDLGLV